MLLNKYYSHIIKNVITCKFFIKKSFVCVNYKNCETTLKHECIYCSILPHCGRQSFKVLFVFTRPDDLGAEVIKHMMAQLPQLDPARVDDLIVGNAVPEAEQGMQIARYISLLALPKSVPGFTINRYCGSGVEAIAIAAAKIHAGIADCIVAGGVESMSMVPTTGWKMALNYEIAKEHADYYIGMGLTAEQVANQFKISREEQDAFSFASHQKALAAQAAGKFDAEIVPITVKETFFDASSGKKKTKEYIVNKDEGPRADTTLEALGRLKPVFAAGGSVTAGNSSQTSDGAAFVVVMSERMVNELNLKPIARMMSYASALSRALWASMQNSSDSHCPQTSRLTTQ